MSDATRRWRWVVPFALTLMLTLASAGGVLSLVLANFVVGSKCPGEAEPDGSRLPPAGDGYRLLCSDSGPSAIAHFAMLLALLAPLIGAFLAARGRRLVVAAAAGLVAVAAPYTIAILLTLAPQDCTREQWEEHGRQGCSRTTV